MGKVQLAPAGSAMLAGSVTVPQTMLSMLYSGALAPLAVTMARSGARSVPVPVLVSVNEFVAVFPGSVSGKVTVVGLKSAFGAPLASDCTAVIPLLLAMAA